MRFLDFIKNREDQSTATEQQSQQQQPETAKQMYTREAIEDKANRVAPTPDQEKRAQQIGDEMRKTTPLAPEASPAPPAAPEDQGSNSAQLQNQSNQDKTQESLSPTDSTTGKTAVPEKAPAPETTAEPTQKTIARPAPSWER
jgi:hypothetical protein